MGTAAKIMVVDDEKQICQNVEKILSKNDYEVIRATSAKEALEKMAKDSFSLLISDIVMPEMNGLEFLKLVKKEWPLTKAVMMTAYASTDTAVKAIRLGALDYLSKPFTPDELRSTVELALSGDLTEAATTEKEREIIDVDIPFDRDDVAKYTGEDFVDRLGPSDMPVVEAAPETLENYCALGDMVCDIFKKLGATCKGGNKTGECPQLKAKKRKAAKAKKFDGEKLIGIDSPFNYEETVSITGPEYVLNMQHEGVAFMPYEELKQNVAQMMKKAPERQADVIEIPKEMVPAGVLVVDDEVAVNNNIRKILSKKGFSVEQAVTKTEALEKIEETAYALVLLDLRMPDVKDLELLKAIRDRRPETMVIIITGYASIETAVEASRLGAVDYLAKPFTPDEIRNATEKAFRLAA
ncbi:MAG: response regulator [Deltaproteobacteria bacterium]|jgi:DNA-binding response OmpR family regulator|nr:response regulator [Deltaproteobacteria bacterium]